MLWAYIVGRLCKLIGRFYKNGCRKNYSKDMIDQYHRIHRIPIQKIVELL